MLFVRAVEAVSGVTETISTLTCEELYEQYATDILRFAYFYLGDRQRAEDVCQNVFVRLLTRKPVLEAGREKAWLLKVAMNLCRDFWRSSWMKRIVLGHPCFELFPAPDQIDNLADKQALMEAVNALPSSFREVVLLHYFQGLGIDEIAETLSLPEGTVSSRLSRARKKIEDTLNGGKEHG